MFKQDLRILEIPPTENEVAAMYANSQTES